MPSFTPPVVATGVPPVLGGKDMGSRLMRYFRARPGGDGNNVYLHTDGTITDVDPYTTYNSDGSINVAAWSDIEHVWYAGHAAETVTAEQQALLEAAGYTVDP